MLFKTAIMIAALHLVILMGNAFLLCRVAHVHSIILSLSCIFCIITLHVFYRNISIKGNYELLLVSAFVFTSIS